MVIKINNNNNNKYIYIPTYKVVTLKAVLLFNIGYRVMQKNFSV